jgi:hypothetical protein
VYQTTLKEVGFAMMSLVDLAFACGTPLRSHQHTSTDRFPPISRRRASFNGLQSTATPFRSVLNGLDFSSRSLHSNEDGALRIHVYDVTNSSLTTSAIPIVSGIFVTSRSRRLPDPDSRCHRLSSSQFLSLTHRSMPFLSLASQVLIILMSRSCLGGRYIQYLDKNVPMRENITEATTAPAAQLRA